jgi:hypothetical protein
MLKMLIKKLQNFILNIKAIMVKDGMSMLQQADVLLICHDVDRGINFRGKAYSPLIDSVREDLENRGLRCQVVAHPWSCLVGSRAWGSPIAMNRSYLWARFISNISKKISLQPKNTGFLFRFYVGMIKKSAARLVITIGAPESLCNATRSLGVCHAELLHGIGYTFVEWGWDNRQSSDLPTLVLSLDSISTNTFRVLEPKGVEVLQIPHPFLKRFIAKKFINELPQEWRPPTIKSTEDYKKVILVALQWGYDGELPEYKNILENKLFPDVLVDIIKETKNDIFWRFRFHPVQLRTKKYKKQIQYVDRLCRESSNCDWEWSSSAPMPTVLSQCQGAISMSSMSVYDAAYMGVPSLLLCPTLRQGGVANDWFVDLVNTGYVTKGAMIKNEIHQWILSTNKMEPLAAGLDNEDAWEYAVNRMLSDSSALSASTRII